MRILESRARSQQQHHVLLLRARRKAERTRGPNRLAVASMVFLLVLPLASSARATPRRAVARAIIEEARAFRDSSTYSKYSITVNTTDGGRVEFLFIWQRLITWHLRGFTGLLFVDTSPILHMARYSGNGSLETSITYTPLFLMQYNDSDNNGLFDLWTRGNREHNDEVEENEIDWDNLRDRPYSIFPLAPMFHMVYNEDQWQWTVTALASRNITVDETLVQEFSWNISAKVPSILWRHSQGTEGGEHVHRSVEWIDVMLGYHVKLLPENPELKLDMSFANSSWSEAKNLRLAMISTILYHSSEPVAVRLGGKEFQAFNVTLTAKEPIVLVSGKAMTAAKAFVSYTPEAMVDGTRVDNAVSTAIQPVFLLSTPVVVPEGLYATGIITDVEGRPVRYRIAFAHQVSVPKFGNSLRHDPTVAIGAELATTTLSKFPEDLLYVRLPVVFGAAVIVAATVYFVASRRKRATTP